MKKIALKVAFWASSYVRLAQMLIFMMATLLCTLSFVVGALLQGTWEIPAFTPYVLVVSALLILGIYYTRASSFFHRNPLIVLLFFIPTYFGYGTAPENTWLRQNASLNFPASTSIQQADDLPKHRKLVRKFIREYKPLIKAYIKKYYKGRKKIWVRILLTLLGLILFWTLLPLIVLVAALFNPSSNGTINLTGPAILTGAGFIFWLIWVWKYKKEDKQKTSSDSPENSTQ